MLTHNLGLVMQLSTDVYTHKLNGYSYRIIEDMFSGIAGRVMCVPEEPHMDKTPRPLLKENLGVGFLKKPQVKGPKFKVGDVVRLKTGTAPISVTDVTYIPALNNYGLSGKYVNTSHTIMCRKDEDFEFYVEKEEDKMNTLYQIKQDGKEVFGHYLATNSSGQWVMEVRGTGDVVTADKNSVDEVLPYTIGVKFPTGSTVYNYFAEKDKFEKGFYLLRNPDLALVEVVALDTKSKLATKDFSPVGKLNVEMC